MKFRFAAVLYAVLALALALFAGTALAGGHDQGSGSSQSADHQSATAQAHDQQSTTTQSAPTKPAQSQATTKSHKTTTKKSSSTVQTSTAGVKPSNTTRPLDTHAAASSNKTKLYGNGKTAGQIATQAGYGNSTLHGPGNSQPHKVSCGGHEVDVHALPHGKCPPSTQSSSSNSDHKVTICHKTGSATNPYVEITVDEHSLKNGHTTAKGDIIPAPAGGCPTAPTESVTLSSPQATAIHTESQTQSSTSTSSLSSSTTGSATAAATAAGGVLGAVSPIVASPKKAKAAGGVLGATTRLGRTVGATNLPFTGLRLWIFALLALGLVLLGATTRRFARQR